MTTCIIPAKGHSSRLPGKNILDFHGKPILAYSIQTAKDSGLFTDIIVSTDSEAISEVAQKYGADVMLRGAKWCTDDIGPLDVARHCLSLMADVDTVCVVYATAPLMSVLDLLRGHRALKSDGIAYSVSVGDSPFLHDSAQFLFAKAWALRERLPEFAEHTALIPIAAERDCDINTQADFDRALVLYTTLHPDPANATR